MDRRQAIKTTLGTVVTLTTQATSMASQESLDSKIQKEFLGYNYLTTLQMERTTWTGEKSPYDTWDVYEKLIKEENQVILSPENVPCLIMSFVMISHKIQVSRSSGIIQEYSKTFIKGQRVPVKVLSPWDVDSVSITTTWMTT